MLSSRPLIAITADLMVRKDRPTAFSTMTYTRSVLAAGGVPVILPPMPDDCSGLIGRFDGLILTGGDDPVMEPYGQPTHPESIRVLSDRQQFEMQLLNELRDRPEIPVLGICLGMQMMGLDAGGELNQHLPETHQSHGDHWEHEHEITSIDEQILNSGATYSKHRQAISDPGSMRILATAHDGVIEAIDDPSRAFYLGVQWHPERTENAVLGQDIVTRFVRAAGG